MSEEIDIRIKGKDALSLYVKKEQNIEIIDKYLYNNSDKYLIDIFEIIYNIKSGKKLPDVLKIIKEKKIGWNHEYLNDYIYEEEEQNNFIIQPFEVHEGVLVCHCGSKRVYSYSKQSRGADEPMSTYAQCMSCNKKWVYSG